MGNFVRGLVLLAGLATAQAPERSEIDRIFTELAQTTGFAIHHPVTFQVISRAQVGHFLEERIQKAVKPDELRAEELTLKKLGFVPADFDLKKITLALLTEQTAAFYDYHRKRLFLTDWASASLRDAATIHEMAHALADQNYSLEYFAKRVENDTEQSAARQAVVEGQASWLMRELGKRQAPAAGEPRATRSEEPFPVFDQAPLYLRETLTFPYTYGTDFQQAVYARMGKQSFRRLFEQPPVSTQQILHPELYFAGVRPQKLTLPAIPGMKSFVGGPLGELDHSILIQQFSSKQDAEDVSPHLRGARYQLWEDRKTGRISLVYRSAWDSESNAQRFFSLYQQVVTKKLTSIQIDEQSATLYAGKAKDGRFLVELAGKTVTAREGLSESAGQILSVTGK